MNTSLKLVNPFHIMHKPVLKVDDDEDFSNLDQTLNKNNLDSINLGTNPSFRKQQAHIPKASNAKASSIEPILKLKANCNFISSFKEFCDGQIEKPNIETYPNPNGGGLFLFFISPLFNTLNLLKLYLFD